MNRLTWIRDLDGFSDVGLRDGVTVDEAICQFANIERVLGEKYDIDHLKELVQAEHDGRLVVLPCKLGDVVYSIQPNKAILPMVVKWFDTNDGWTVSIQYAPRAPEFHKFDAFGKTVFLTREEAQAALAEEETK